MRELLARNLKSYRDAHGLSQEELAYRAEIHRTYMNAIERCRFAASIDVLAKLAQALGVEPADLLRTPIAPPAETTATAKPAQQKSERSPAHKKTRPKRNKT